MLIELALFLLIDSEHEVNLEMKELIGNPAAMGLIGVIIGSVLSLCGALYSEYIKLKSIKLQQKQVSEDDLQKIFSHFVRLISSYKNFYMSQILKFKSYMDEDEVTTLIKDTEQVLAELDLKASTELSVECHNLYNQTFTGIFNQKDFNVQYRKVIDMMKKELKTKTRF